MKEEVICSMKEPCMDKDPVYTLKEETKEEIIYEIDFYFDGEFTPPSQTAVRVQSESSSSSPSTPSMPTCNSPLENSSSHLQSSSPTLQTSSFPSQSSSPPLQRSSSPLQSSSPPLLSFRSPLQCSSPPFQTSFSLLQTSSSPSQTSSPPFQTSSFSLLQTSNSPSQTSNPPLLSCGSPFLVRLPTQSRKVQRGPSPPLLVRVPPSPPSLSPPVEPDHRSIYAESDKYCWTIKPGRRTPPPSSLVPWGAITPPRTPSRPSPHATYLPTTLPSSPHTENYSLKQEVEELKELQDITDLLEVPDLPSWGLGPSPGQYEFCAEDMLNVAVQMHNNNTEFDWMENIIRL